MKTTREENFRVVIYPKTYTYGIKTGEDKDVCENMIPQIKRHIDDIQCVSIECDSADFCSFCGRKWTEESTIFNGGCCNKDLENEPQQQS